MTTEPMDRVLRLGFLDALAKHIGHVEHRNARERTAHRWGYGPVLVWSASSGTGTAVVLPYSSGSGVVRVHLNRYSAESRLLGWTAEITCMPEELVGLAEWVSQYIRERSMGKDPPANENFLPGHYGYLWTKLASRHDYEHTHVNARGSSPVKDP